MKLLFALLATSAFASPIGSYVVYPDCGGPCPQHVPRTPTPAELTGLTDAAFDAYLISQGFPDYGPGFAGLSQDSNAHGWVIGEYAGPNMIDSSFVYRRADGITCCTVDMLAMLFISATDMISAWDAGGQFWFRAGLASNDLRYFNPPTYLPNGQAVQIFVSDYTTPKIVNELPGGRLVLTTGQLLVPAPEPSTIGLMIAGVMIALWRRRTETSPRPR